MDVEPPGDRARQYLCLRMELANTLIWQAKLSYIYFTKGANRQKDRLGKGLNDAVK